jgi:hypothetical protein
MTASDQDGVAVEFYRSTEGFSKESLERAAHAKLRTEIYYKTLMAHTIERNQR